MSELIPVNFQIVGGPLKANRNMFRFPGNPLSVKVLDGENEIILCRITENDFDERDVTIAGIPVEYCVLAHGLAALWPTAAHPVTLEIKAEV